MKNMMAFCGLNCDQCGAYVAKQENDQEKRVETAEIWSKTFKAEIHPGEIECDGCNSKNGVLFKHCRVCEVRKCGREMGIDHCAECEDYPCAKLEIIFAMAPEARDNLDAAGK